jgi:hypothetical protein
MGTKQINIIIIGVSVCVAAGISYLKWNAHDHQPLRTNVYKVAGGWGYDILVNDRIVIHQESIPVLKNKRAFTTKEQAEQTAALVIKKLRKGQPPTLTKPDLEKILPVLEIENDR